MVPLTLMYQVVRCFVQELLYKYLPPFSICKSFLSNFYTFLQITRKTATITLLRTICLFSNIRVLLINQPALFNTL